MKDVFKLIGIAAFVAVIGFSFAALSLTGCGGGDDGGGNPKTVTYQSADAAGYTYILIITVNGSTTAAGDSYVLTIKMTGQPDKVSKGKISAVDTDGTLTLQPKNSGSESFDVTISGGNMTAITGSIAIEGDGESVSSPGTLTLTVTFSGVTANGSASQTTTQLTLTFSQAITGLSADDITLTGVNITKGTLSGSGPTYTLPISGFTAGGTLNVAVAKLGYTISGSPKTATIYYSSGSSNGDGTTFNSIAAFKTWLDTQPANTAATPYTVKLNVSNLGGNAQTSGSAGSALKANSTKSVSLDLSGSTFTSTGDRVFEGCTSLTSVTIGNSVISIGWDAFQGTSLTSITIPNSVISIGQRAFMDCTSLTSVTIGNSVTSIGKDAFGHCTSLTSITIPNSVTSMGDGVFGTCTKLASVTLPTNPSFTSIAGYAFSGCTSLTSVTIPNSVTSIGECAFNDCTSLTLTGVTIGNSVISIGKGAFYNCTSLTSVTIPASVTSIGGGSFYKDGAFNNCANLTSVTFATGSNIANASFGNNAFPEGSYNYTSGSGGNTLKNAYSAGKAGTYTREEEGTTWTKS